MTEALLKSLERSSLMLVATDASGRVEYANEAARSLFGSLDDVNLSSPPLCDDPRGPMASLIGAWESLEDRRRPSDPHLVRVKSGGLSYFLWFHSVPNGAADNPGVTFLVVDLTAHLTGSEPVRKLVGQLAHDLRSPLTSIAGAAELLLSGRVGPLPGVQEKLVKIVDDGASKMATIIQHAADEGAERGTSA